MRPGACGARASRTLLRWTWQAHELRKNDAVLTVTAMPGQHGLGRSRVIAPPPVMGSLLKFTPAPGERTRRVYISGDTLCYDGLRDIGERYPDIDLALLHLDGTRVLGLLLTMDAAQGIRLLDLVRPRRAIPIHFEEYGVMRSPLVDFQNAVKAAGLADQVRYVHRGETAPLYA